MYSNWYDIYYVVLCGTEMSKKENKLSIIDIKALYGELLRGYPLDHFYLHPIDTIAPSVQWG